MGRTSWLIAAALICSPAGAQGVREGIAAWQKGDPERAVTLWRPLAEAGDADAAFNLGQAYRLGKGVALDLPLAQSWLEKAARKGHVDAATNLGILLFQNGNRVGAMRWLRQAADGGEARAMLLYGTALFNGDGVASDPVRAYAYVSRAAAQGLAPAQATLADMDSILSLDQRKAGLALAQAAARGSTSTAPRPPAARPIAAKPIARPPVILAAPTPNPVLPGGWRIQLGAFAKRSSAEALFARLAGGLGGRQAYYIPAGAMTRLQAGPYESRAAAGAACARLSTKGQPCFVVAVK